MELTRRGLFASVIAPFLPKLKAAEKILPCLIETNYIHFLYPIVSIRKSNDKLLVATTKYTYELADDMIGGYKIFRSPEVYPGQRKDMARGWNGFNCTQFRIMYDPSIFGELRPYGH